jgi:tRNA pseudouridine55 synthase
MSSGILCVDKPRGKTSHDIVAEIRRLTGIRSVGHTGTLDPDASGLLLLCLGRATKFARCFEALDKTYWTVLHLGIRTDTQDATGAMIAQRSLPPITPVRLRQVMAQFTGRIQQVPPMYSAVKHRGQRLYRLARQGKTVHRQAREVDIRRLDILDIRLPWVTLHVTCSKGTYIRTLCDDIGETLGCGAYMQHLQRCRVGPFSLAQSYDMADVRRRVRTGEFGAALVPPAQALQFLPTLSLDGRQHTALRQGQGRIVPHLFPELSRQTSGYRLRTEATGTFAVILPHGANPQKWKLSYLEESLPDTVES